MDWLSKLRCLHYPDHHPTRDPVVAVNGHAIGDFEPTVSGGNTSATLLGDGIVEQTLLRVKQVRCIWRFVAGEGIENALTRVEDVLPTAGERRLDDDPQ